MSATVSRSRHQFGDRAGTNQPIETRRVWGLRSSYNILVRSLGYFETVKRASQENLAKALLEPSNQSARPNARRTTGRAIAIQTTITLLHLGLLKRVDREFELTTRGHSFAKSLGLREEQELFRDALVSYAPFATFWADLTRGQRTVSRGMAIDLAARVYPWLGDESRKMLAGVCLNYAAHAGLCARISGSRGYSVSLTRLKELSERLESDHAAEPTATARSRVGFAHEAESSRDLVELARVLGWLLADERQISSDTAQSRLTEALQHVTESANPGPLSELVALATDMARSALRTKNIEQLRWAIRCVNGVIHAGPNAAEHDLSGRDA